MHLRAGCVDYLVIRERYWGRCANVRSGREGPGRGFRAPHLPDSLAGLCDGSMADPDASVFAARACVARRICAARLFRLAPSRLFAGAPRGRASPARAAEPAHRFGVRRLAGGRDPLLADRHGRHFAHVRARRDGRGRLAAFPSGARLERARCRRRRRGGRRRALVRDRFPDFAGLAARRDHLPARAGQDDARRLGEAHRAHTQAAPSERARQPHRAVESRHGGCGDACDDRCRRRGA